MSSCADQGAHVDEREFLLFVDFFKDHEDFMDCREAFERMPETVARAYLENRETEDLRVYQLRVEKYLDAFSCVRTGKESNF